jgi:hypothetical protein
VPQVWLINIGITLISKPPYDAVPREHIPILCCERFTGAGDRLYSSFAVLIKRSMKA